MATGSLIGEIPAVSNRPKTFGDWVFSMLLGILFCIGMPAAITAMAPVTYLKLTRNGDHVSAQSKTCLLLVVPYYSQSLENVTAITSDVRAGEMMEVHSRPNDTSDRMIRSEDEGWLILSNGEKQIKVLVSPANLDATRRAASDFIEASTPQNSEYTRFCVANWKASIFAGVPLTMLTVLFLVCVVSPVVALPLRLIR